VDYGSGMAPPSSAASAERQFADYCCELLASVGPCTARRMFGGWGLSVGGPAAADRLNIAIIAWDTLYLKASAETEPQWVAAGGKPFRYEARGKTMKLNYYTAPDEAMESAQLMAPWARLALQSALKARKVPAARSRGYQISSKAADADKDAHHQPGQRARRVAQRKTRAAQGQAQV
jgi:DNA transformation protein and related proteins